MARRYKTVASPVALGMMHVAEAAGMDPADFTARTGVSAAELRDATGRVERPAYERMLDVAWELVMHERAAVPFGELGWVQQAFPLLAVAWLNAPTARGALAAFLRYRSLLGESDRVSVREREGTLQLRYEADGPPHCATFQAMGNFGLVAAILRAYDTGAAVRPFAARLSARAVPALRGAAEWLGGRVEFDGNQDVLEVSTAGLDVPSPQHNPALHRVVARALEHDLAELARGASPGLAVERALRGALDRPGGMSGHQALARVCAQLQVTAWTLRRRLGAEGLTFGELYARTRIELARTLLDTTSCSLAEVSERVGFTSPSAFTRFFHQREGITPCEFRAAPQRAATARV